MTEQEIEQFIIDMPWNNHFRKNQLLLCEAYKEDFIKEMMIKYPYLEIAKHPLYSIMQKLVVKKGFEIFDKSA